MTIARSSCRSGPFPRSSYRCGSSRAAAASADCLHGVREERQSLFDFAVAGSQRRQQLDHLILGACGFHQRSALECCRGHLLDQLTVEIDKP